MLQLAVNKRDNNLKRQQSSLALFTDQRHTWKEFNPKVIIDFGPGGNISPAFPDHGPGAEQEWCSESFYFYFLFFIYFYFFTHKPMQWPNLGQDNPVDSYLSAVTTFFTKLSFSRGAGSYSVSLCVRQWIKFRPEYPFKLIKVCLFKPLLI